MDIHEYQAKQLIAKYGVSIPVGEIIYQPHEAVTVTSWLNEDVVMVKAQVHAGGRGKSGGIKKCNGQDEVVSTVEKMIGMKPQTPQTGEKKKTVTRVYIEKAHNIEKELYFCIIVDRETGGNTIIASANGGMDIEEVAKKKS